MNENMQNALAEIIRSSMTALESTKNFLVAELPDVIHQLLLWKFATSFIAFAAAMSLLIMVVIIWYKNFKVGDITEGRFIGSLFFTVVSLITVIFTFNLTWLQIWLAPKIFLIEYAAKLVK